MCQQQCWSSVFCVIYQLGCFSYLSRNTDELMCHEWPYIIWYVRTFDKECVGSDAWCWDEAYIKYLSISWIHLLQLAKLVYLNKLIILQFLIILKILLWVNYLELGFVCNCCLSRLLCSSATAHCFPTTAMHSQLLKRNSNSYWSRYFDQIYNKRNRKKKKKKCHELLHFQYFHLDAWQGLPRNMGATLVSLSLLLQYT